MVIFKEIYRRTPIVKVHKWREKWQRKLSFFLLQTNFTVYQTYLKRRTRMLGIFFYIILPHLPIEIAKHCSMFKFSVMHGQIFYCFSGFLRNHCKGKFRSRGTLNTSSRSAMKSLYNVSKRCLVSKYSDLQK